MTGTYIDSRGATMPAMEFSEALEIVYDLAEANKLADFQMLGDPGLVELKCWYQDALETVQDIGDDVNALSPSTHARIWSRAVVDPNRHMDASVPLNAIKIVLGLGVQNALAPEDVEGMEMADEVDRQQQAIDIVRDLLGMHSIELERFALSRAPAMTM